MTEENTPSSESTPNTGLPFNRVAPIFALTFVDVLGLTIILPLLHLYAIGFGATPLQIGLVAAAFPLSQLIGVPIMGALSDRFGRKPLLLISQITTCIGFLLLASATSLEMIVLSRVIDGLFGANLSTAQAAITDITDDTNRARGLGLTGAAFGLGFIFGPVIALIALEVTDSLAVPALTAAVYSFLSILLTLFVFKETLPPEKRGKNTSQRINIFVIGKMLRVQGVPILLLMLFAEQLIFFGFENLMGVFTLSRLGLLGQGTSILFLIVGIILVTVQVRYIGKWSRTYGEKRLISVALGLLAVGLLLVATTPQQPHPFYVRARAQYDIQSQVQSSTEAIIGDLNVPLPAEGNNGIGGVLWFVVALIPISVGASLIRPNTNSLLTKSVSSDDYGSVLGVSASVASGANALAPILCGWIFQQYGANAPFLLGGIAMGILALVSIWHFGQTTKL
jgi:MFS transporter, DHA1 family, tetracycline resistance protein